MRVSSWGGERVSPRRRARSFATRALLDGDPEEHRAEWSGIALAECIGNYRTDQLERLAPRILIGLEHVESAVHDDAAPIVRPVHLVHLERYPLVVSEYLELLARRGASIDPALAVEVVHRNDVHPIVERIRDAPDVVSHQDGAHLARVERAKVWMRIRVHASSSIAGMDVLSTEYRLYGTAAIGRGLRDCPDFPHWQGSSGCASLTQARAPRDLSRIA